MISDMTLSRRKVRLTHFACFGLYKMERQARVNPASDLRVSLLFLANVAASSDSELGHPSKANMFMPCG